MENAGFVAAGAEAFPGVPREHAFSPEEYRTRVGRVQARIRERGLDALLVQHPSNVLYLSGYNSKVMFYGEAVVLPADGPPTLAVLDWEVACAQLTSVAGDIRTFPTVDEGPAALARLLAEVKLAAARVGVEERTWNVTGYRLDALRAALPRAHLVDASGIVEAEKVIKSPAEIDFVRKAASISDLGIRAAVAASRVGATDNDVAAQVYAALIGGGSEYMSMDPVVLAGRRSSIMHASHHRFPIMSNDQVVIELGAVYQRYVAPLQRTIAVGDASADLRQLERASTTAIENMMEVLKPGAAARDIAAAAQAGVDLAGPDVYYHKGCAYSVGLAFPPNWVEGSYYIGANNPLALADASPLAEGMVLNLPMSLRYIGRVGFLQNETVVVTATGCESLSQLPRRLLQAGEAA